MNNASDYIRCTSTYIILRNTDVRVLLFYKLDMVNFELPYH